MARRRWRSSKWIVAGLRQIRQPAEGQGGVVGVDRHMAVFADRRAGDALQAAEGAFRRLVALLIELDRGFPKRLMDQLLRANPSR